MGRVLHAAPGQVCGGSCPQLWGQGCPWFLGREGWTNLLCFAECFQHPSLVQLWTLLIRENVDTHQEISVILKLHYKFIFLKYSKYYIIFVWFLALEKWEGFLKWQLRCPHLSGVLGFSRDPMDSEAFSKVQKLLKGAVWKQPNLGAMMKPPCRKQCWLKAELQGTRAALPSAEAPPEHSPELLPFADQPLCSCFPGGLSLGFK